MRTSILVLPLLAFCFPPSTSQAQSFLERLEQRVRERIEQAEATATQDARPDGQLDTPTSPAASRPTLGFVAEQRDGSLYPVAIVEVADGSAAARAGIRSGDSLVSIDNRPITSLGQLRTALAQTRPGSRLTIRVARAGRLIDIPVVLEGEPDGEAILPPPAPQPARRPLALGVNVADASALPSGAPVRQGAVIETIEPASLVAGSGLKPGDVIVAWNGRVIVSSADFAAAAANHPAGAEVELTYYRDKQLNRVVIDPTPPVAESNDDSTADSADNRGSQIGSILGGLGRMLGGNEPQSLPAPQPTPAPPSPSPDDAVEPASADDATVAQRLETLERQLQQIVERLDQLERRLQDEEND